MEPLLAPLPVAGDFFFVVFFRSFSVLCLEIVPLGRTGFFFAGLAFLAAGAAIVLPFLTTETTTGALADRAGVSAS